MEHPVINQELGTMPLFEQCLKKYDRERPFKGYSIAIAHVLVPNTLPLISSLVLGGADVLVTKCNPPTVHPLVIQTLKELDISVDLELVSAADHDLALDCAGYFANNQPKIAVSEVTRTGYHIYANTNLSVPVINVDDTKSKLIETFYGNPISVIRAVDKFLGPPSEYLSGKTIGIAGFGKIGRGIARVMRDYSKVKVFEIDSRAVRKGEELGFEMVRIVDDPKENTGAAKDLDIMISVTGHPGVISKYFIKSELRTQINLNLGATDEFGDDYKEGEIFMSKHKPFNFNLTPPTPNIFIDPILVAHLEGIRYGLDVDLSCEIHPLSQVIDQAIVSDFELTNKFDVSDLDLYFD